MSIAERYQRVAAEVAEAAVAAGRAPEDVLLVAVSKTVGPEGVAEAIEGGARDFGENRPDQIVPKSAAFPEARWHFIGNIQSRRIPEIVSAATLIHSVCKEAHLAKIDAAAAAIDKCQRVLLEVNVSGEESKSGFEPSEVKGIIERARSLEHVKIEGLMSMAPRAEEELINATFSGLANLESELNDTFSQEEGTARLSALSMGMTEDWPVALRYGSTIVRIGRAIFSDSFENA